MACLKLLINITSPPNEIGEMRAYIISESSDLEDTYNVGMIVSKTFHGRPYRGKITENTGIYCKVVYDDNDSEVMNHIKVTKHKVKQWKLLCQHSTQSYTMMMDGSMWNKRRVAYNFKDSHIGDGGKTFRVQQYMPVSMKFLKGKPRATLWFH